LAVNAWFAKKASNVQDTGQTISSPNYNPVDWIEAVVPGTVLTTLLKNGVPGHFSPGLDPYFGQNSQSIPDISDQGYADMICRGGDEPAAALLVLMGMLENSTHPKVIANTAKHFAFTC
jgi:hypothetical protein